MPDDDATIPEDRTAAPVVETPPAEAVAAIAAPAIPELGPAACAARLTELFPALFAAAPPKPIKLRIQADIQTRAPGIFTKKSLSIFLHRHTTSTSYLKGLVANTTRFDLDGQPAGELAEEHRNAAGVELERRRALFEAKRAAEREAQREQYRQAAAAERQQRDAEFEARRERAAFLRAFETSTLTRANFCALKGIADAELDARLELARKERAERPPPPTMPPQAQRPRPGGDERGPRRDRFEGQRPQGKGKPRPPAAR